MGRWIDADKVKIEYRGGFHDDFVINYNSFMNAPSIDIVRCGECASYCGDGNKCLWGLLTGDMGYCHHGYRGGDCIAEQTERGESDDI